MKYLILVFCTLLFGQLKLVKGQNLIANPSFESFTSCPTNANQVAKVPPWQRLTGNHVPPTFFNPCSTNPIASVPTNGDSLLGYQFPRTGNGYVGFNFYLENTSDLREYLLAPLLDSLDSGKTYLLEFYVNLFNGSKYGIDRIGGYISATPPNCSSFDCLVNVTPQVVNPIGNIITDTVSWVKISGSFVAQGDEKFITIGNFFPDSLIQKSINRPGFAWSTVYLIDDVSLKVDTSLSLPKLPENSEISVWPNPAQSFITIKNPGQSELKLTLKNINGIECIRTILASKTTTLDISTLSNGVYIYEISDGLGVLRINKIIVLK